MKPQKTYLPKPTDFPEKWYLVDADGETLGRLAARVAKTLRGKTTPQFARHVQPNTHVIIVNAERIQVSGDKMKTKIYKWHTAYRTGLKEESAEHLMARKPTEMVRRAVAGMVPKTILGRRMMKYLRVYAGPEHPHKAQNPEVLKIRTRHVRAKE